MKKCNDVMTKDPLCCLPGDRAIKAADLMKSMVVVGNQSLWGTGPITGIIGSAVASAPSSGYTSQILSEKGPERNRLQGRLTAQLFWRR